MKLKSTNDFFSAGLLLMLCTIGASMAQIESEPTGLVEFTLKENSDNYVTLPFQKTPTYSDTVAARPTNETPSTIPLSTVNNLVTGDLVGSHLARFTNGALKGRAFPISANSDSTITLVAGSALAALQAGDALQIVESWILGEAFPSDSSAIQLSTSLLATGRGTEILFFDSKSKGAALAPNRIFFRTAEGWFEVAEGLPAADDTAIPLSGFIIRQPDGATDMTLSNVGESIPAVAFRLDTRPGSPQDSWISMGAPVHTTLSQLGLESFISTGDEVHVYTNQLASINRQPLARFYHKNGKWFRVDSDVETPDYQIDGAIPIRIIKAKGGSGSLVWTSPSSE